ncbi:phospho-N-acetylmuramoyl-pentapeptide-transferase [Candidatus Saganbacteria bacterium]|nr:phospho-N-acetylmuramoyl-pentapeptide-transferase [Candidatus Saganbacteria bacterium]
MLPLFYLFVQAFSASFLVTYLLIKLFTKYKFKQIEREEGPQSHKIKSGTPTMGGIGFVPIVLILSLLTIDMKYIPVLLLYLGFSFIGFTDDFVKVFKGRNLGLTFWQKIILQTIFSACFAFYIINITNYWAVNPAIYFLFLIFIIIGAANAANLTDGLDGLLAGTSILAFVPFFISFYLNGLLGGAALSLVFIAAIFGFLFFNFPKAMIFMGDTGSLGIGAALSGFAIISHHELVLIVVCGVYLVEALSVIIQVISYKLWKRRVFKMAPLHHHFELLGFSEMQVVLLFWSVQAILSIIGVFLL